MNTKTMKKFQLFALGLTLAWLLSSCTSATQLSVLQPAEMTLPDHIEIIAAVDRSKPAKGFNTVAEGILTGEGLGQDRAGRRRAIDGLTSSLTRTPRFQVKNTGLELEGSKAGDRFPPPLDWGEVSALCEQYGAHALLAIEQYDTDNFISTTAQQEKRKDKDGKETIRTYFDARMNVIVKIGWRLYDPERKIIIDEFLGVEEINSNARGDTDEAARRNLPSQSAASQDVSYIAGQHYGMRIAPVWITVSREFYPTAKGAAKEKMQQAARYADAGQWEEAARIWNALVSNPPDAKTAGRAAHNLAVAGERLGKLDLALEWAERAYLDFGNKRDQEYIHVLRMRINDERKVESQLKK
jgi:hypothetical protein